MARPKRKLPPGIATHVVQRGNNRLRCFFSDNDRRFYVAQLAELSVALEVGVHAYVLMDNHVHLLMTPTTEHGISLLMKNLGQRFVQFVNREHGRTGGLWEGRFYSSIVEGGAYLFTCHGYIEMNPGRAGMVRRPRDYRWSSYRAAERARIYRTIFDLSLGDAGLDAIREATRGGFAFGSEDFTRRMTLALGREMAPSRRRVAFLGV